MNIKKYQPRKPRSKTMSFNLNELTEMLQVLAMNSDDIFLIQKIRKSRAELLDRIKENRSKFPYLVLFFLLLCVPVQAQESANVDTCGQYYNLMDEETKKEYDKIKKAYDELKAAGLDVKFNMKCKVIGAENE